MIPPLMEEILLELDPTERELLLERIRTHSAETIAAVLRKNGYGVGATTVKRTRRALEANE